MFRKAVMDFLEENQYLVKKEANRIDFATNKKKYTPEQALQVVVEKLFREYCTV